MKKLLFLLLVLASLPLVSEVLLKEMKKTPTIDGVLSEDEWPWRIEQPFSVVAKGTVPEIPPRLFMGYDDGYIYVALKLNKNALTQNAAHKKEIFSRSRAEFRFGTKERISMFALAFDGEKFPSQGWEGLCKEGVIEAAFPLEMLPDTRVFSGNIVVCIGDENSSLFPIGRLSFDAPEYHGKFSLGTAAEIEAWQTARAQKLSQEAAINESMLT